jgi:uncharacterized protein involved in type VI secretion and phage assembly
VFDLESFEYPQTPRTTLVWTDAASRTLGAREVGGSGPGRPLSRSAGFARVAPSTGPALLVRGNGAAGAHAGGEIRAVTHRADLRPGDDVEILVEQASLRGVVEAVHHRMAANGSHESRLVAVDRERLGLQRGAPCVMATVGPFQAAVTHNDDPEHLGRVRVVLSEDAARRPTSWIPIVEPYAGHGTGTYLVPEVGDLVTVVADATAPESLLCLGSLRGREQRVPNHWSSRDNSVKVIEVRRGYGLAVDEARGTLRLYTPGAAIELRGDGRLDLRASSEISIVAERHVELDAPRIDVGR